jgi:hypothetical protein
MTEELELSAAVKQLQAQMEQKLQQKIKLQLSPQQQTKFLRNDQGEHFLRGGQMVISVANSSKANFIVAHELLHIQQIEENIPQLQVNLTTGDLSVDNRLIAAGLELYDTVMHFRIYQQQRALGLISTADEAAFLKGILATLKPEKSLNDQWMALRLVSLLDALTFFTDQEQIFEKFAELYPRSLKAAKEIYQVLTEKKINGPLALRRTIVLLFEKFEQQLTAWNYPDMQLKSFLTLTPVLSTRQTRLQVRQLFELFHGNWLDNLHDTRAYIGYYRNDRQNSFVLPQPKQSHPEAYFKHLYQQTVADFMQENGFAYQLR